MESSVSINTELSNFNNESVMGDDIIREVLKSYTTKTFAINKDGQVNTIGPGIESKFEITNACGYPSVDVKVIKDSFRDESHQVSNPKSPLYIKKEKSYMTYHICQGKSNVVGLYIIE